LLELAVLAEPDLVRREHVRRRRHALELDDLELEPPAVRVVLDARDRLRLTSDELRELLARAAPGTHVDRPAAVPVLGGLVVVVVAARRLRPGSGVLLLPCDSARLVVLLVVLLVVVLVAFPGVAPRTCELGVRLVLLVGGLRRPLLVLLHRVEGSLEHGRGELAELRGLSSARFRDLRRLVVVAVVVCVG